MKIAFNSLYRNRTHCLPFNLQSQEVKKGDIAPVLVDEFYTNRGGINLKLATALSGLLESNSSLREAVNGIYSADNLQKSTYIFGPPSSGKSEVLLHPFQSDSAISPQGLSSLDLKSTANICLNGFNVRLLRSLGFERSEISRDCLHGKDAINQNAAQAVVSSINSKLAKKGNVFLKLDELSSILDSPNEDLIKELFQLLKLIKENTNLQILATGIYSSKETDELFDTTYEVQREPISVVNKGDFTKSINNPSVKSILKHLQVTYHWPPIFEYSNYTNVMRDLMKDLPSNIETEFTTVPNL